MASIRYATINVLPRELIALSVKCRPWILLCKLACGPRGAEQTIYTRAFYPAYDSNLICLAI